MLDQDNISLLHKCGIINWKQQPDICFESECQEDFSVFLDRSSKLMLGCAFFNPDISDKKLPNSDSEIRGFLQIAVTKIFNIFENTEDFYLNDNSVVWVSFERMSSLFDVKLLGPITQYDYQYIDDCLENINKSLYDFNCRLFREKSSIIFESPNSDNVYESRDY